MRGVLARPLRLGAVTLPVNGVPLAFTGVDVITLDQEGLISAKHTYFDILAAAAQSTSVRPPVRTS